MQPFDGDRFDKRYTDVFEPAIRAAGLVPYRVDRDPSVTIPIESIERGISEAAVGFAEITTDNPNVWYELGFAFASGKPICMVCSKERTTPYPFDVRHRALIIYETSAPSDFHKLSNAITSKLAALLDSRSTVEATAALPPDKMGVLRAHDIAVLAALMSEDGTPPGRLHREMEEAGFTKVATSIAIERLKRLGHVGIRRISTEDGDEHWLVLCNSGIEWILANEDKLKQEMLVKPNANFVVLGAKVEHESFGRGIVQGIDSGADPVVTVKFQTNLIKRIKRSFLKIINE